MDTPLHPTRFGQALAYATQAHAGQARKISGVPYVAHLLGVASLALEYGATADEAIASLLHDVVEDQGGLARLEDVQGRFGIEVARLVEACSDSLSADPDQKAPWRVRKLHHLERLETADASVRLVTACDKLHNLQNLLRDLRHRGPGVWEHFKSRPGDQLWYYRSVLEALRHQDQRPYILELSSAVEALERAIGQKA